MKKKERLLNRLNNEGERDASGRFEPGCKAGPGNPFSRKVNLLRTAMLNTVTPADMVVVVRMLIKKARSGNLIAAKELFERTLGRPVEVDIFEKIENLEKAISEFEQQNK